MASLNKVLLIGNLGADPELKQTQSGISVVSIRLAVNRRYVKAGEQAQTDWIPVTAWRQQAEFIARYFKKGSQIFVQGSLQSRNWTDQSGQKRTAYDVVADEVSFVGNKQDGDRSGGSYQQSYQGAPSPDNYSAPSYSSQDEGSAPKFEEMSNDDDLPF